LYQNLLSYIIISGEEYRIFAIRSLLAESSEYFVKRRTIMKVNLITQATNFTGALQSQSITQPQGQGENQGLSQLQDTYSLNSIPTTESKLQATEQSKDVTKTTSEESPAGNHPINPREWTVLCYFNGNCNLEPFMAKKIREIGGTGSDDKIAFISQISMASNQGNVNLIHPDANNKEMVEDLGKVDMKNSKTFYEFLSKNMKQYPAEHYMVIVNGHGRAFKGVLKDNDPTDGMPIEEFASVLNTVKKETGKNIDILGLDSCLMGNAETVYAVKDAVKYVVVSEEESSPRNWKFDKITANMKQEANGDGLTTEEALANLMKSQKNSYTVTSSVIDCTKMPQFTEKMKAFAEKLLNTNTSPDVIRQSFQNAQGFGLISPEAAQDGFTHMRDLISITKTIISNNNISDQELKKSAEDLGKFMKENLILENMTDPKNPEKWKGAEGLSIFAPVEGADRFAEQYSLLSLAKDTNWDKVAKKYGAA
jgi:hypothetical protein